MKIFLILIAISSFLVAHNIQLIKKENNDSNTTLLVIGGIHGNEPGGYFSAAILATHYKILTKNLWIVPNLNAKSIIKNRRGIHGDMNRKFASIKKNDKDKKIVEEIKQIILKPQVSLILNLHDGHGFYRENYKNSIFNPNAWGQTCVIDQCKIQSENEFGNLDTIAQTVKQNVNRRLLQKGHSFNVKNTKTKYKDEQMRLSLTYFAVTHNKPAFAIETSKNLSTLSQKVFYQLVAIEEYMKIVGIKFQRDFTLNQTNLKKIIKEYGTLKINSNILLNLSNIKKHLSFIPIKSRNNIFRFSHPLGGVIKHGNYYNIYIGNKKITQLKAQPFELSKQCPSKYELFIDNEKQSLEKASYFEVNDSFKVHLKDSYRVNIIGFHKKNIANENNITINLADMNKNYAVDTTGKNFRVEVYNNDKFCTMLMVHFK
jgi:hypothetical protein